MQVFYTGSSNGNFAQQNPSSSLGGYISTTRVPNNRDSNIFGPIAYLDWKEQEETTLALGLYNETSSPLNNFKVWVTLEDGSFIDIDLGLSASSTDSKGVFIESIQSSDSLPFIDIFEGIYSENDALQLASIPAQSYYGLWLTRRIKNSLKDQFSDTILEQNFNNNTEWQKNWTFTLQMSWD